MAQVNGGSQSFNAVNALRLLARWMRMPCCTNQSSIAKAWQEFDDEGRMKPSNFRERVVDVAEEFAKFTAVMAPVKESLTLQTTPVPLQRMPGKSSCLSSARRM